MESLQLRTLREISGWIKADAPEEFGDRPFCVAMFSESDVAASGLNSLAYSKAAQLEQLVYKYGKTWEEVTPSRHAEVSWNNFIVLDFGGVHHKGNFCVVGYYHAGEPVTNLIAIFKYLFRIEARQRTSHALNSWYINMERPGKK